MYELKSVFIYISHEFIVNLQQYLNEILAENSIDYMNMFIILDKYIYLCVKL